MKRQPIKPPDTYLGVVVPDNIKRAWCTWEGVQWRIYRHADRGVLQPPDQRFSLTPPEGLCALHLRHWYRWRNRHFAGIGFPGVGAGDGFVSPYTMDFDQSWEWSRWQWDEQTREQMRAVEEFCAAAKGCTDTPPDLEPSPALRSQRLVFQSWMSQAGPAIDRLLDELEALNQPEEFGDAA